ncbi:MAG: alpha/beta hydrolase, partial [Chitinophagaceae bacterium]
MKALSLSIFILIFQHIVTAQVSLSGIVLPYGNYQVGFDHYTKNDHTRSYIRKNDFTGEVLPRPVPISIWYPAILKRGSKPMMVVDYMRVLKEEEEWEVLPDDRILDWFYYSNSESNKIHLQETTHAQRKAKPSVGKFPVVIYAPSYQASSAENFALCELLSSHGYIVISSPGRGTVTQRLDGGSTRDMETQARDIQFLIAEISGNQNAELSDLSIIGFSFGGISNVLAQMMDKRIRSVVCLDGSVRYQLDKLKRSPYFNIEHFDVPFLFMAQKEIPEQVMKEDNINPSLNSSFAF